MKLLLSIVLSLLVASVDAQGRVREMIMQRLEF